MFGGAEVPRTDVLLHRLGERSRLWLNVSRRRVSCNQYISLQFLWRQAREEAIARGEDPDAAEALILNGGAPAAIPAAEEPIRQPQSTGLEGGGRGLDIAADVSDAVIVFLILDKSCTAESGRKVVYVYVFDFVFSRESEICEGECAITSYEKK